MDPVKRLEARSLEDVHEQINTWMDHVYSEMCAPTGSDPQTKMKPDADTYRAAKILWSMTRDTAGLEHTSADRAATLSYHGDHDGGPGEARG